MSYTKILIDNTSCSRRFHVSFDDAGDVRPHVELKCPFCDVVVFSADNHPEVKLARQENLVQTAQLSDRLIAACDFSDPFEKIKAKKIAATDTKSSALRK